MYFSLLTVASCIRSSSILFAFPGFGATLYGAPAMGYRARRKYEQVYAMVTNLTAKALGQRIRQLRTRKGLTQQDLAGSDYSKSYISAIEQGKTRPSLEALQRISSRLEMPAGVLLDPDAPGFAPFDPEALPRRVRRRRGVRAGQGPSL